MCHALGRLAILLHTEGFVDSQMATTVHSVLISGAQQSLQEVFHKGMTLKEAIKHAMTILKQVMEEKLSETNVEVATVTKENGFQLLGGDDLQTYIKDLS